MTQSTRFTGPWMAALVVGLCCLSSCGPKSEPKPASTGGAPATSAETGSQPAAQADAGSAAGGHGGWMSGIPAVIPQFRFGIYNEKEASQIAGGADTTFSMYYKDVTPADMLAYAAELKAKGFTLEEDGSGGAAKDFTVGAHLARGQGRLVAWAEYQANGHVDFTVRLIKKYE
jgi:hypothetical protein